MPVSIFSFLVSLAALASLLWSPHTLGATPAVAAGESHTAVLKSDGTVWAWGSNANGRLGDAGSGVRATPAPVAGLVNVIAIAAGAEHTLALRSDGTVWAWGRNNVGQLGDSTTTDRSTPVQVSGVSGATAIAAGGGHSLALRSDGTVMSWGRNDYGQLGDATQANRSLPGSATTISGVSALAAGKDHSVAIKSDGSVWTWGRNHRGQLGDGSTTDRLFPVQVDRFGVNGVVNIIAIAAGESATYAVRSDGGVRAWGDDTNAQLGVRPSGTATNSSSPLTPSGLSGVTRIAAGATHVVALKSDGTVWTWGSNFHGEAGSGTPNTPRWVNTAAQVAGVAGVTAVAAGGNHTVALKSDNTLLAWGYNAFGQIGNNAFADTATPRTVAGGRGAGVLNVTTGPSPQTGWWWNPSESGRGYSIEVRGNNIFVGAYLYADSGRATWLAATGAVISSSVFQGDLLAFGSGQTLTGDYRSNAALPTPGRITLQFIDESHGTLTWPGGAIPIERYNIVTDGLTAPPAAFQPESGWWWNADEPGRGFALEIQKGTLFMAGYMYDADGNAIWYLTNGAMASQSLYQGYNWVQYANGQTLTGAYRAATVVNSNVGPVTLQFSDTANALLTLPNGRQLALTRFRF